MSPIHLTICAVSLAAFLCSPVAAQTMVESVFTGEVSANYSDPSNWSPREVPDNSPTRSYNVRVPGRVVVDLNVRVSNLIANGIVVGNGASVVVAESATIGSLPVPDAFGDTQTGLSLLQGGLFAVEGTLTNFDASTRTLKGGSFYLSGVPQGGGGISILRFPGADIVHNDSTITLLGPLAQIVDETGLDALRNLASNTAEGVFSVGQRDFIIGGDFTNAGTLSVAFGTIQISGRLTNFDATTGTLTGGTYQISSSGRLRFAGADIVRNAASIAINGDGAITDHSGNDALRNLSFNESGARFLPPDGYTTSGSFTNAGEMIIASSFGPGGGRFTVSPGHRYVQTGGSTELSSGDFTGDMHINGGELTGSSSFFAGIARVRGNLVVGAALLFPGGIQISGAVQLASETRFRVVARPGDAFNPQQAALLVDGPAAIAGTIEIEEPDAFPTASNAFMNALQSRGLTGTFSNAPNGTRLPSTSGRGSYLITYQNDSVLVGGYQRIPPAAQLLNISTRAKVSTGDDVTIGGFIISGFLGNQGKKVVVRGIGPSLVRSGVMGVLEDPVIELRDSRGNIVASNDNWKDGQADDLRAIGLAPENDREAAIIATLPRGSYTVIMRGSRQTEGVGLVEVYDAEKDSRSKLANISTRGLVDAENLLIGGYISGGEGPGDAELTVRAIGPGLRHSGVSRFLPDPTVEVRDKNGALIAANDDHFVPSENHARVLPGLSPNEQKDAATGVTLPRGEYTVLVRGKDGASGIALVEIYDHNR